MKLDVVVPTYNRSRLLRAAVTSLLRAPVPAGLEVNIFVIDNNSRDDTPEVVRELQAGAALPVHYFREFEQGSSQSRNRGIAESSGDLVGFIDDDEEIDPTWYEVVEREFRNSETEFIGGPYIGKWVSPRPDWLPPGYHAAIGHIPPQASWPLRECFWRCFDGWQRSYSQIGVSTGRLLFPAPWEKWKGTAFGRRCGVLSAPRGCKCSRRVCPRSDHSPLH